MSIKPLYLTAGESDILRLTAPPAGGSRLALEVGLLDLRAQLRTLERSIDSIADARLHPDALEVHLFQLHKLAGDAGAIGQSRIAAVAQLAQRLMETSALTPDAEAIDVVALLLRALELIGILLEDARRQLEGRMPAALDDAIAALAEHVGALAARYGWGHTIVLH